MRIVLPWAVLYSFSLLAQKPPVDMDAVLRYPAPTAPGVLWSPDGKRLVYRDGDRLLLYDVAARRQRELLHWPALEDAATKVPPAESFDWENRRVAEQPLQWTSDSRDLIALAGGDVFLIRIEAGGWVQLTATPYAERDPKISPDGRLLAWRYKHNLYVMPVSGDRKVLRLTHDGSPTLLNGELDWVYPEELELGTAYWWSPDSKKIAFLQLDTSREIVHPHVDMLGLFAKPEPQRYPKAGTPNPDVRLGVVPVTGGAARWMDLGELRDRLIARVYWLPDSVSLAAIRLNRVQNELHLFSANAGTGVSRVLLAEKDAHWVNLGDEFRYLPKRQQFLWSNESSGYRHLYLHERNGKPVAQLTSGDWEVTDVVHADEAGERVFYMSTETSPLERHLYSVSLRGGERRRLTTAKGTHNVTMSPNGEYWTDFSSTLSEPPRLTLHDAAGGSIAVIQAADRKPAEDYSVLPTELTTFRGSDGTTFHARIIKPPNMTAGRKYPAVVVVYGGPHAQTVRDQWPGLTWEQLLAQRGFVIWQMDNRGSGGRGHAWESRVARRFGRLELEDQKEGVRHLISLGYVDPERIGITGWSYGGFMTLTALLHAPEVFKAGISGAPVTDWRHYDTIYTERYMGLPAENPDGYRLSSPVHFAAQLRGKLMLVHNYGDDNVLYQHNMQMQIELQKAGKHYELLVYPQKAHGVSGPLIRHMREAMVDFFERALR